MRGRNGRHKIEKIIIRVHLMQQQQLHSESRSGWVIMVGVGLAPSIASLDGSPCWLSILPSTTPLTAVWTRTAHLSSFSTTTPVVSLTNITAFPSSSITTARSTRLAIPPSLYNRPRIRIVNDVIYFAVRFLVDHQAVMLNEAKTSRPRPRSRQRRISGGWGQGRDQK